MNYPSVDKTVARKYAQAYLSIFSLQISIDDIKRLEYAERYIRFNKNIVTFLSMPLLDKKTQQTMIETLITHLSLAKSFSELFSLMISRHHSALISDTLWYIAQLYKKEHNFIDCAIISSHDLNDTITECIKRFFEKITKKNIIYHHILDKKLIAGIRLQSIDYMWEYSVRKQIKSIAQNSENIG